WLFKKARSQAEQQQKTSAVVFIDEIDVLGVKRGSHASHMEYDQTLNQLLTEMDGINTRDKIKILVVAATNRVDTLDPALLRPGRFDRVVRVDLPDKEGRLHILKIHTKNKPLAPDVDLMEIARDTFGFSGAHLENLANEAAIQAMRASRDLVTMSDFKEATDKVMMGEKLDRKPGKEETRRVAGHEAGHALVSELVRPNSVSTITITSRGRALGYMRQTPQDDQYLYTREELLDQIAVTLGGAVTEELIFGSRSTGSAGDFEQAVDLAKRMVYAGMSSLGVVSKENLPDKLLHEAIQQVIAETEDRVRAHLSQQREAIEEIAQILLENEKISGDDFRRILAERSARLATA
ncbi:MAG: AAA family ATPase, partial [Firmicutes bacterium]|nr:AAA family ATPase [Bacillota bacterium]